jgi:hypothetical protein
LTDPGEGFNNLTVFNPCEILVKLTYGIEGPGNFQTYDLINNFRKAGECTIGTNRNRYKDLPGLQSLQITDRPFDRKP